RHTRCYRDWSSDVCSSDLLAEQGRRRRDHRRMGGWLRAGVDLQVRLHPVSAGEPDSLHAADADATQDDRVPDVQTADGPEPGGVDRLRAADVGTREPQGAAYHDRERRDHDEADDELVLALHPGRPSM